MRYPRPATKGKPQPTAQDGSCSAATRNGERERHRRIGCAVLPPALDQCGQGFLREILGEASVAGAKEAVAEQTRREFAHHRVEVHAGNVP